jgi:imidazolonepropionase-like amidohydrolase
MRSDTRREFLAGLAAGAGAIALRDRLRAQADAAALPGLELAEPTTALVFRNVTVIDGTGAPARSAMFVRVAGPRIEAVAPLSEMPPAAGARVVDATGKFLIPGLWEMHGHIWDGGISPLFIPNGITGVRMMGGARGPVDRLLRFRREVAEGQRLGPRLFVASQTLTGAIVSEPASAREAVRYAVAAGVDFIKVHADVSRDAYFSIIDEASKGGRRVVGHVPTREPNPMRLEECARAGQRSFEHMAGVIRYLVATAGANAGGPGAGRGVNIASLTGNQARGLFDVFLRSGAWLCPTLTAIFGLGGRPSQKDDPRLRYIDETDKTRWAEVFNADDLEAVRERFGNVLTLVRAMHEAGVGILAGSDTAPGAPYVLPGFGLHDELKYLTAAGIKPIDALRCASSRAAEFLGVLDFVGTVTPGKLAELVLLDANPLDDIGNTTRIQMVLTHGRSYDRLALDRMLSAIEAQAKEA